MPTEFHQIQSNSHRGRTVDYLERSTSRDSQGDEQTSILSETTVKAIVKQATKLSSSTQVPDLNETQVGELPDNAYIVITEDLDISKEDAFRFEGFTHEIHRIIDRQGDESRDKGKVVIVTR